ncbi:Cytochrome c6 [Marinomonas aquimarina]|uniref:Cytochrome c6 n=1 Tax=Marinomonas aquimarina TaxID=295068 RepID=A0A1A8TIA3_9GAMM|nr:cytochrome c [Marinomonas aquimarina]SBS32149.1 Cytochrome c6 [Marinomonas aquimarina]
MGKVLLTVLLLGLFGCTDKKQATTDVQNGNELYSMYCASCHKESGNGQFLAGIPRNRDTQYSVNEVSDLIRVGHQDKPSMPTFSQLTPAQAYAIAAYLKYKLGSE